MTAPLPPLPWHSLALWTAGGARGFELHCLDCRNVVTIPAREAIDRWGPSTTLVEIGRRARCRRCGRKGCHVQGEAPPPPGTREHEQWLQDEVRRERQFTVWAHEYLAHQRRNRVE